MCGGPTSTQEKLSSEEADFYQTQIDAYNKAYKNFSSIQDTLNAQFAPILAKGPNQFGFSDEEVNNLNTMASEGTARGYSHALQALQESIATEGGGTSNVNLTSGGTAQMKEEIASQGAGTESAEKLGIQQAGFAQGLQEWNGAVAGEEDLAAGWNPNSFAGSANNSAATANSEADTIAKENNSVWTSVMGALGGLASNASYDNGKQSWSL